MVKDGQKSETRRSSCLEVTSPKAPISSLSIPINSARAAGSENRLGLGCVLSVAPATAPASEPAAASTAGGCPPAKQGIFSVTVALTVNVDEHDIGASDSPPSKLATKRT
jgi:hypothetical protein